MTRPRREIVSLSDTPYYHCISRCVRRAFLCGEDRYSGRSYEHRRDWLEQKLHQISSVFAIKLAAYAVMSNHYHVVLHVRQDIANSWSDREVIERWHQLFAGTKLSSSFLSGLELSETQMKALTPLIVEWRTRLTSISWFMRLVNEWVARRANLEDECKGRFWEGRFKSQALLDEKSVLACMAYVDLNPIRAGQASTPEDSKFTSVHHRIKALSSSQLNHARLEDFVGNNAKAQGIPCALRDYLELVDWTARIIRSDKQGYVDQKVPPILNRINFPSEGWVTITTHFESQSRLKIDSDLMLYQLQRGSFFSRTA